MTSACFQSGVDAINVDSFLFHQQRGNRFEHYTEINILTITQSSLDTSGVVGMCLDASVVIIETSFCSEPFIFSPLNPSPYSNALAALMLNMALPKAAWSLPKQVVQVRWGIP